MTKAELFRQMARFAKDPNRAVSWDFFAEMTGISAQHLQDVFVFPQAPYD